MATVQGPRPQVEGNWHTRLERETTSTGRYLGLEMLEGKKAPSPSQKKMFPRELSQAEIKMITEKFEGSLASKGLHDDHHQTYWDSCGFQAGVGGVGRGGSRDGRF